MVDAEPRTFVVHEQDAIVLLENVAMHRAFEADKSGKTTIHVWMQADATPRIEDFEKIAADLEFVLYSDEDRLGSCSSRGVEFAGKDDRVRVVADAGLHLESHVDVTHVEVTIDSAQVIRAKGKSRLDPA